MSTNTNRRERALALIDQMDPSATRSWGRRDWIEAAFDAYEAELAADLESDEVVRRTGEAMESEAIRWLGRDLGTLHRDDIARAAIAAALGTA